MNQIASTSSTETNFQTRQIRSAPPSFVQKPIIELPPKVSGYFVVFDLETTGLPPKTTSSPSCKTPTEGVEWADWPYITQLSAILYHSDTGRIQAYMNYYIQLPEGIIVPPNVVELTGITTELCNKKGVPLTSVICSFYELYCRADYIVAHNLAFDKSILRCEVERNAGQLPVYCRSLFKDGPGHPKHLCTMLKYQYYCGIPAVSNKGWNYTKMPRLSEVYNRLFQGRGLSAEEYQLHNSIIDTLLCLRCLIFFECGQEIPEPVFASLITTLSEPMERPLYSVSFRTRKHLVGQSRMILCG